MPSLPRPPHGLPPPPGRVPPARPRARAELPARTPASALRLPPARNAVDTASAHAQSSALAAFPTLTHAAKQEFQWVKNEYLAREQMALGKIKEGAIMAIEHPGIAAGSTAVAGIVLFKRPRSYLIQRVRRIFVSKETLLSGIQAEVNHMRHTVNLVSNESQKLMDRAATAEKRFQKGWNTLREEGRAIQSELKQISDIENQTRHQKWLCRILCCYGTFYLYLSMENFVDVDVWMCG